MKNITITVPATSANVGPGFDVLGIAVSLFLKLRVNVNPDETKTDKYNIELEYLGDNSTVPLDPEENIITKVALHVMSSFNINEFPKHTKVIVENCIPLGRGLGSSAAAIVSGVLLADTLFNLRLTQQQIFSFCLVFENHPDNTTPAIVGGVSASYVIETTSELDSSNSVVDHVKIPINPIIKAVVVIPEFELSTSYSRSVLPKSYNIKDIVYNLQRIATLSIALGQQDLRPELIFNSMKDSLHQPYRAALVPGLAKILSDLDYKNTPGLVGICLSGAGPTTLALATDNFDLIAQKIQSIFDSESNGSFKTHYYVLDVVHNGAIVQSDL
ncbi:hypothetical protein BB561_005627 [Smittium simulii]|uniref:Homoserine kinase n=1 Tax=Smittium simulii TaxID=133385 RepID=A0A2T9Y9I0_9FUNG|nr:hypothetical protein BB561_005627 [Smittium simulii]